MKSVYRFMDAVPEGTQVAVFTTSIFGTRLRLGDFPSAIAAAAFIANRTRDSVYCPQHDWMFINPQAPRVCPGPLNMEQPWIKAEHNVPATTD